MTRLSSFAALALSAIVGASPVNAQQQGTATVASQPVTLTAEEDHARTMRLLGITSLRPGANGNDPKAPNAANYDEALANPYPNLPDPLLLMDRERVTTPELWWTKRRPEIVELFDREVYGRVPASVPRVEWTVKSTTAGMNGDVPIVTKELVGHVDNSAYPAIDVDIVVTLSTPANAKAPVPVIMQFGGFGFGFGPPRGGPPPQIPPGGRGFGGPPPGPSWQSQALAKGWGYATLNTTSVQADNGAGLTKGIIGLTNKGQPRSLDDWGVLRAWAWGASRALDYFATDRAVDAKRVAVEGHSRWGKAALVAMAYDQRFAIAYVSSSGEGGAKLNRRNAGELVENLTGTGEYHWMAGNFLKYGGPLSWNDLPIDSHELIALCAPRPVFISAGAVGDAWVDARGMFTAAAAAQPVYELLGKRGMGTTQFPAVESGLLAGDLAFRQHSSGHTDGPNWPFFLTFAERYLH